MTVGNRTARAGGSGLAGLLVCLLIAACSSVPSAEQQIPPTTPTRHAAAVAAIRQLGDRYQAGAAGPKTYGAAGLVYYAYRQARASLPRDLQDQLDTGQPIERARAAPADLLFFQVDGTHGRPHKTVGLLVSKHHMVIATPGNGHQDDQKNGVRLADIDDDYWRQRLVGVIQVLPRGDKSRPSNKKRRPEGA